MGAGGFSRREWLALVAGAMTGCRNEAPTVERTMTTKTEAPRLFPAAFISHGSPMVALEQDDYTDALRAFGRALPSPRAIVVVSAHWETRGGILVTGAGQPELIYDFGGFPGALYALKYPSPGDPALAARIVQLLEGAGFAAQVDPRRGYDHGAWVPLRLTYPDPTVPVVQVSLPRPRTPADVLRMGAALAPLRAEGVLLLGSGGVVHNLRVFDFDKSAPVQGWARAFDDWAGERLAARDVEGLADYARRAPNASLAVPTTEHYDPQFFALGASRPDEAIADVYVGLHHGTLSMRSFATRPG
jgi:4,5-DOPA dioxygenase extradiol